MNWGTKIAIAFVIFGIIMGVMITISFNQEINLVAEDYYKQEIEYESQIEKIRNTNALENKPEMVYITGSNALVVKFPAELRDSFQSGEIHFFRPSDYKMDKKVRIELDSNGTQSLDLKVLEKGLWQAKMTWRDGAKEFYEERKIVI